MMLNNSKIEKLVNCEFGGGGRAAAPTPPPPPSRDAAADKGNDVGNTKRRGYQSTILGGKPASAGAESNPLKTLLGQ